MSFISKAIDIGKFIPGLNVPCSAISLVQNVMKGNFLGAGLDALGIIPVLGVEARGLGLVAEEGAAIAGKSGMIQGALTATEKLAAPLGNTALSSAGKIITKLAPKVVESEQGIVTAMRASEGYRTAVAAGAKLAAKFPFNIGPFTGKLFQAAEAYTSN